MDIRWLLKTKFCTDFVYVYYLRNSKWKIGKSFFVVIGVIFLEAVKEIMVAQNIYDHPDFFAGYAKLNRSVRGLDGAPEWGAIQKMLPDLKKLKVVDLGCGYGWFCRYAKDAGASRVLGYDLSEKMLAKAKTLGSDDLIEYQISDLEILKLPENTFDLVYSSLTLHYVERVPELLGTIFQSLKTKGHFVFSVEHPIYTAATDAVWMINEAGEKIWPVNHYQQEGLRETNWLTNGVMKQHRTLGTYLNLLIETGFRIERVEEWGPSEEQLLAMPELAEERERPMLVLISACK